MRFWRAQLFHHPATSSSRLLGRRVWDIKVQDRHSLWRAVSTELEGIDNEKRRELHNQYRAA